MATRKQERGATRSEPAVRSDSRPANGRRVALGVCGGIAAYKAAEVLRGLQRAGCEVRVGMTKHASEFVRPLTFRALSGAPVVVDDYAPENPDPIAHITFAQTVDLLLIAPATANIIAKFAHGVADDFLTSTYLAATAPTLLAPAMNTQMWLHPATVRNVAQLRADGVRFVAPDDGEMACGTIGPGRLSEPERIVAAALELLQNSPRGFDLRGERVLLTSGATREAIDPVRFLSNHSSGRMGFALAEAARVRGAEVIVVAASTTAPEPTGVELLRVTNAEEMRAAVMREIDRATIFIGAAAVADYRPVAVAPQKIKKTTTHLTLELERTPDVLAEAALADRNNNGLIVVGFAAETIDAIRHAREKLERKKLDLIVANDVTLPGAGFGTETNVVSLLTADRSAPLTLPLMTKLEVAHRILDEIAALRAAKNEAAALAVQEG